MKETAENLRKNGMVIQTSDHHFKQIKSIWDKVKDLLMKRVLGIHRIYFFESKDSLKT